LSSVGLAVVTALRSFLFVTWEGGGNVPPVLGLARRLVSRGHRVRVLTEPALENAVEEAGALFVPFTEHFTRTDRREDMLRDSEVRSPVGAMRRALETVIVGPAEIVARHCERALDTEPADALAVDFMMPGAGVVGEARRIPTAILVHSIDMQPGPGKPPPSMAPARGPVGRLRDRVFSKLAHHVFDTYLDDFNRVRERRGLAPLAHVFDQFARAERILIQTCREFDFPVTPAPANLRYVGPVIDEPDWLGDTSWQSPWPADDPRPLVLASFSSTFQNQQSLLQKVLAALGRLDVRGLVTLGPTMVGRSFDVPDNVVVVESAPHGLVFPHTAVFVTHCGHGSVIRALAAGVPLVAVPMGRDQTDIAIRIVERGVGLRARRRPRAIAAAVRRVLDEPGFRVAARRLASKITNDVAGDRGVAELEALGSAVRHQTSSVSSPSRGW
jgi:MGT family glycosyltransferase